MLSRSVLSLVLVAAASADLVQKPIPIVSSLRQPEEQVATRPDDGHRKLHGRFLHITDIHPDPYYKYYTSTAEEIACHRGTGPAGYYGAETSDCDSPLSLVNATFDWIHHNLKDKIDFIIWTGDSARHDNDEHIPRNEQQVLGQNRFLVNKFEEVFGSKDQGRRFEIPIVPSFGNNDILPHNIFLKGPNKWTRAYADVWRAFIPEEQRHGFDRGGWFYVEVVPNRLAVFSLNTMYFFDSNAAVNGCADPSQPGFEHMEWLRTQLQFLREGGVKAILSGHVPPARNDDKVGWDETCWQKYTLWLRQFRDVVVGSVYGHMNIEHFVLQDFGDVNIATAMGEGLEEWNELGEDRGGDVETQAKAPDYLMALRELWADLPTVPDELSVLGKGEALKGIVDKKPPEDAARQHRKRKDRRSKEQKFYDKIGGAYAERYAISHISASLVPNFFSTMRVFEYNITGLNDVGISDELVSPTVPSWQERIDSPKTTGEVSVTSTVSKIWHGLSSRLSSIRPEKHRSRHRKHRKHKKKKPKKPNFTIPDDPSPNSLPGPAYSPQTLSWLGYKQYIANNTYLNNDFHDEDAKEDEVRIAGWNPGRHTDRRPGKRRENNVPAPRNFTFEVEYDTMDEKDDYRMGVGLTVRKWVELAARIGEFHSGEAVLENGEEDELHERAAEETEEEERDDSDEEEYDEEDDDELKPEKHKKKHGKHRKHRHDRDKDRKKRKKRRRKIINRDWFAFVSRGVTATMSDEELHDQFGEVDARSDSKSAWPSSSSDWDDI